MVGRRRDGWLLFGVMVVLFIAGLALCGWAEQAGNPRLGQISNVDQRLTDTQAGGNMEGKETRFGIGGSVLTAITTSNGATGLYNSMHDSRRATEDISDNLSWHMTNCCSRESNIGAVKPAWQLSRPI